MKLPHHPQGGVQVGVSDVLAWRDCAARAKLGRRRLEGNEAPESWSPQNAYGSAIHDCLSALDNDATPEQAAQAAFARFKQWLEPSDVTLLLEDMRKFQEREAVGVRTLLNEGEIAVPLFVHPVAGQVWFRSRIDRLYQSLDDPGLLFHTDYKSGKYAKSHEEVAEDIQLWAYNFNIFEWFTDLYPEVENVRLLQTYDQLRYGEVPTQKDAEQRAEIKRWLIVAITAMIEDEVEAPTFNQWCPWCPLKMDCPVVQFELTEWATIRIAALMPREPKTKKDGTPSKVLGPPQLDSDRIVEYVKLLPEVHRAAQVLTSFDEIVRDTLKQMPDSELQTLGKAKAERSRRAFTTEAKRKVVDEVGLTIALMIFDLSLASVDRFFGPKSDEAVKIAALAEKLPSYIVINDA
jgi:hypothetical protein